MVLDYTKVFVNAQLEGRRSGTCENAQRYTRISLSAGKSKRAVGTEEFMIEAFRRQEALGQNLSERETN